jgi:hypothetical protein
MTPPADVRVESAPLVGGARGLFRWVCTNNPFYVLSAGLFLAGLWISFGTQAQAVQTWALMAGLAGYTLLLAVTACLLVRFAGVWDDARTVLLLVVLLFLATSVTFDEVLVLDPGRGVVCYLGGLLFAVALSEGLLRGIRLALPAWFRGPYYLILALFFLYPLALSPLLGRPRSEELMWGLFGFSAVAGLVFLTLLPAIRRGPDYVRGNGSPWPWPLYPWVLFGLLAFAVPARAFLLCWSLHLLTGSDRERLIFGLYFLVPFVLVLAVLLLEIGIVSGRWRVLRYALAVPLGLVALALAGHRPDPVYQGFLEAFTARLGGDPLYLTLLASACFYAYAAVRRVRLATEALTAALVVLAFVAPDTLARGILVVPRPAPLLAAAALQLGLGFWRRNPWRCLLGSAGVVAVAALAVPGEGDPVRGLIAFHLALFAVLAVGAAFRNSALGRSLRTAGAALVLLAGLAALFVRLDLPDGVAPWALVAYPLVLAALLAGYGVLLRHRPSLGSAVTVLACWLAVAGWRGYSSLRQVVTGLDHIAGSLALFAVAVLISLGKSGLLGRWLARTGKGAPLRPLSGARPAAEPITLVQVPERSFTRPGLP